MKKLIKIGLIALCMIMITLALVGCNAKFDENKEIIVVSRELNSGSRDAFMELVFGSNFKDIVLPTNHVIQTSTQAVLAKVKTDPQAIAYDSVGFVTDDVKTLKVDGVECTPANVASGDYKLMRPFSVVYKDANLTGANAKFNEFLKSSNAQPLITAEGLMGDSTRTTAYVVQEGLTGTININGGTTVQILVEKLAAEFKKLQPGVTLVIGGGGSGVGRNSVRDDVVDFGMVGTAVTPAHITDMQSKGGTVSVTKLCDDGIAIVVHKSNTFDNITIDQLKNIYNKDATTKYSNWAALRG